MMIAGGGGARWQEVLCHSPLFSGSPAPRHHHHPSSSRLFCPSSLPHIPQTSLSSTTFPPSSTTPLPTTEVSSPPPSLAFSSKSTDSLTSSSNDASSPGLGGRLLQPVSVSIPFGNRQITVETGLLGRQASGAATVTDGETILYATACASEEECEPSDFIPLSVHYQERYSAAGRTSGGFFKREGRAKDNEVLVCRLIDRPLRPIIPKGFNFETQILSWVFSYDSIHSPEPLAVIAASAALALSDVPVTKIVGAVRVGLIDGNFVVNPTVEELKSSKLDMVIAGSEDSVIMIEGCCDFVTEEELLQAISIGQEAVSKVCNGLETLVSKAGKLKRSEIRLPPVSIQTYIEELVGAELMESLNIASKSSRRRAIGIIENKVMETLTQMNSQVIQPPLQEEEEVLEYHEEVGLIDGEVDEGDLHVKVISKKTLTQSFDPLDVKVAFKDVTSKFMRKLIVQSRKRSDGRGLTDIRPIQCSCSLLPRAHGSALFTRGETQALAVTTLGGEDMGQRLDNLTETETKRFYLQYSFPNSSVGETGRVGAPSRREIGHGVLAERALEFALPSEEEFPYTIRLESTITESNGSSSMASVCGGCLAMLDAGVPLKQNIAGVAMGLILNSNDCDGEPIILSDIIGAEDALGDMDFKIAGSEEGITAFQMDIKVEGISLNILKKALLQAKEGRRHILGEMAKCEPPPTRKLSKYAPLIETLKVDPEKVNGIIGSGGKTVRAIIEQSGVDSIDLDDDGSIRIIAKSPESLQIAKSRILGMTTEPIIGTIYRACVVKSIVPFGCFIEISPGREGLCHISEVCNERLEKVDDVWNVGDRVDVKLIEINSKGQLRLSHKALLGEEGGERNELQPTEVIKQDKDVKKLEGQKEGRKQDRKREVKKIEGQKEARRQTATRTDVYIVSKDNPSRP